MFDYTYSHAGKTWTYNHLLPKQVPYLLGHSVGSYSVHDHI